jgi:hypothetical protein
VKLRDMRQRIDRIDPKIAAAGVLGVVALGGIVYTAISLVRSASIVNATAYARPNSRAAPYVRSRDPRQVNSVVLHQMGFSRGNDFRDYIGVTAHYVILPDGKIYQLYGHDVRLPASDDFNATSVAVEFAGNMPSRPLSSDPDRYWFPSGREGSPIYMNHLTNAQAKSGRALLRHLRDKGIHFVFGHSQSTAGRGNDPGPEVWGAVAEYGIRKLGMSDGGPNYAIGSGQPIRQSWHDAYAVMKGPLPVASRAVLAEGPSLGLEISDDDEAEDDHGRDPEDPEAA